LRASTSGTPYTEDISEGLQDPTLKQTIHHHYNNAVGQLPCIIQRMTILNIVREPVNMVDISVYTELVFSTIYWEYEKIPSYELDQPQ
jgi:hypothetical protein